MKNGQQKKTGITAGLFPCYKEFQVDSLEASSFFYLSGSA